MINIEGDERLKETVNLGDDYNPVIVWLQLQSSARTWKALYERANSDLVALEDVIEASRECAIRLETFDVKRWIDFSDAVGWSAASICALSWCRGGSLDIVLRYWTRRRIFAEMAVGADFSALLIRPDFIRDNKLSGLLRLTENDVSLSLLLAALKDGVEVDVHISVVEALSPVLQRMIALREL